MKIIQVTIVINADDVAPENKNPEDVGRGIVNDLEQIGWTAALVSAEEVKE